MGCCTCGSGITTPAPPLAKGGPGGVGRFITEDPIRDGLNWYAYCGNNPANGVDPWGLLEVPGRMERLGERGGPKARPYHRAPEKGGGPATPPNLLNAPEVPGTVNFPWKG